MTTKRELEARLGRSLRPDIDVVDDVVVRVDAEGTIVERFAEPDGDGIHVPAPPVLLTPRPRTNRPGMASSYARIGQPPTVDGRQIGTVDPDAIPADHPDRVAPHPVRFSSPEPGNVHKITVVDGVNTAHVDERGP